MRKKTKTEDLNMLEEGVSEAKLKDRQIHRKAILEMVYDQMKDPYLEAMRVALIDALKRNDIIKINEIKQKITNYAKSRQFIERQLKAVSRISKEEADLWLKKKLKEVRENGR